MQMLHDSASPGKRLRASRRTLARLKANPKAKALVPKFKPSHDALKAAQAGFNDADDHRIDVAAVGEEADFSAREGLTDFQLELLGVVRRDYKDPTYFTYLPEGFDAAKNLSGAALRDRLIAIVDLLTKEPKGSKLAAHIPPLNALIAAYKVPLADLATADKALGVADTALTVAKSKWLEAYDSLAGELRALFPRRKAFVDSFFPEGKKAKKKVPTT